MVEDYLKDAVTKYKNISIPGFGVFSTQELEAALDEEQGVYSPPQKTVSFEARLVQTDQDDSLVNLIKEQKGCSQLEAEEEVGRFVTEVNEQVKEGEYKIEGFGYFYKDSLSGIAFQAYDDVNLLPDSYGLPKLAVTKLPTLAAAPVAAEEEEKDDSKFGLIMIPLVVVIFAVILVFVSPNLQKRVWGLISGEEVPEQVEGANTDTAAGTETATDDTGESGSTEATTEGGEAAAAEGTAEEGTAEPTETVAENPPAADPTPAATETTTPPATDSGSSGDVVESKTGRWYLSIASFTELGLAKKDVAKVRANGYPNAKVVVGGPNKYRVSIADYASKGEADQKAADAKSDYASIWVFKF